MSFYLRAEGIILKYLYFLNEKNVIKNYKINKQLARTIYMEEFKPQYKIVRFPFSTMYRLMLEFDLINYKSRRSEDIQFREDVFNYAMRYYTESDLKQDPTTQSSKPSKQTTKSNKTPSTSKTNSNKTKCNVCSILFSNNDLLEQHETSDKHLLRMKCITEKEHPSTSTPNIVVQVADSHGGKPETIVLRRKEKKTIVLNILNSTSDDYVILQIIEMNKLASITLTKLLLPCAITSNTKECLGINLMFNESIFYTYPLILKMKNMTNSEEIDIVKEIMFQVHSELVDDLQPTRPYKKEPKQNVRESQYEIVPGVHSPENSTDFRSKVKLQQYHLPQYIVVLTDNNFQEFPDMTVNEKNMLKQIIMEFASFSKIGTLSDSNYYSINQLRLYMEEHQMKIDIRLYDVENQELHPCRGYHNNFLELFVPGLAEHRPSVLRGDSVFIQESRDSKVKYEGIVSKVNQNSVILGFSHTFSNIYLKNKKYSVSFSFNRIPLRVEHQANELARKHGIIELLCPIDIKPGLLSYSDFIWYNKDIGSNLKQQDAIKHILSETSRPAPYLIFGPPGTGKTVTVVEAILQVRKYKPDQNILVCTPSNSAADEITKRLVNYVSKSDLFRYVAPSFPYDLVNPIVRPYINFKNEFYHPANSELLKYHVMVTTLITAARLINGGTPPGHFSYVFIDESGQATETETLIPITGILTSAQQPGTINGQIVLAGDPQQLGPIIHSRRANDFGFATSMLERLMNKCEPYKKNNGIYNSNVLTKLINSYRSHPSILELPNKMFYDNELVPPTNRSMTDVALGWEELPNKNFPIIFHSVFGQDNREANSPSFFNLQEIDVVIRYLDKLIGNRLKGIKIQEEHIGVITPYRKQVFKLQAVCKKKQWNKLTVGCVEQFQGQERLIIIVSTVRSRPEFTVQDEKFHLGFLRNPKRFNVALTRAKALLIVVGNPNILLHDDNWRSLIKYCKDNGSVVGSPFELQLPAADLSALKTSLESTNDINGAVEEESVGFSRGNI